MNKLTKNKLFFNIEKIISITVATSILIAILSLTSCNSYQYTYKQKFHTNYSDKCPTFKNKINSFDI
jgi:cell division protein FtsL